MTLEKYLQCAKEAVNTASEYLLKNFGSRKIDTRKGEDHYGIDEDEGAHKIYEKFLNEKTPHVKYLSEEGDTAITAGLAWMVDPIEGTYNYQSANEYWGTQIALLMDGKPVVAVVCEPKLQNITFACQGMGCFFNDKQVKVSSENELLKALVSTEKGVGLSNAEFCDWLLKIGDQVKRVRIIGATGLNMARVARGTFEMYIGLDSADYDYAPGALLIREAGGVVWNLDKENWLYGEKKLISGSEELCRKLRW